jgi:hypothetical protein
MSATTTSPTAQAPSDGAASAFTSVLSAAVSGAATRMDGRISRWTDKLNDIASGEASSGQATDLADEGLDHLGEGGGSLRSAGASGLKARVHGRSPFRAAVKALWKEGSPAVKAAVVTAIVATILLLILSPVLLLVFLLSLLVIAAVTRARRSAGS